MARFIYSVPRLRTPTDRPAAIDSTVRSFLSFSNTGWAPTANHTAPTSSNNSPTAVTSFHVSRAPVRFIVIMDFHLFMTW